MMGWVLAGWVPLIEKNRGQQGLSFKEQLALESQFHPSWAIRCILRSWQKLMEQGQTENVLRFLVPWPLPSWQLTLDDFYDILSDMALPHPQSFPIGSVLRNACVLIFISTMSPEMMSSGEFFITLAPCLGLVWESWEWGKSQQLRLILRWWEQRPIEWARLNASGIPEPVFITKKSHQNIWQQVWSLTPDLGQAAGRFASYIKLAQLRAHARWRQFWGLLLDISTLWLFTQMTSQLLQGFYHA